MGKLAQSWFGLGVPLLFLGVGAPIAEASEISPKQIGYYCHPDEQSIVDGQFYQPTSTPCFYESSSLSFGPRYGVLYRGTIGSSTLIDAHAFSGSLVFELSDLASIRQKEIQQGEDLFVVIFRTYANFNLEQFRDYFERGIGTPPHNDYGFIRFKYGAAPEGCAENCNSNILFLPGIMGSRLQDDGVKIWEPASDADVQQLYLDAVGKSVNPDISATQVIETFDGPLMLNFDIYDSFLEDLERLKQDGLIADYAAYPYDWRLSIPDIVNGSSLEDAIRNMASSSRSGKVSIVAHSNGGLVAKALLNQLGDEASDIVDMLILVGVPQVGTPQAVGALLHGADSGVPLRYSEARAREFARNSPMTYHLLPHPDYYQGVGATISTPVITFDDSVSPELLATYGRAVGTYEEMEHFIQGSDGREQPAFEDLHEPAVGNAYLLNEAQEYLQDIGGSWVPPSDIEVHQIAGIGEDTLAGITYSRDVKCVERYVSDTSTPYCLKYEETVKYTPKTVKDGDGTVILPSALAISTSTPEINRTWLNLKASNDDDLRFGIFRIDHKNIFEVPELRKHVINLIRKVSPNNPTYITDGVPVLSREDTLRYILHSPLALSVLDNQNRRIDEHNTSVPGGTFKRYGEVQVISVPRDSRPTLFLEGLREGSFTLDIEEYTNGLLSATSSFQGIPSSTSTKAKMEFLNPSIATAGKLMIDYDGNGAMDISLSPKQGEQVRFPKIPLAIKARNLAILLGAVDPSVMSADIVGFQGGATLDTSDIVGVPECTTNATATSSVGVYEITCAQGTLTSDIYSFDTFIAGELHILYDWKGFLQPIDDPVAQPGASRSIFKAGSTVPVKFQLTNVKGNGVVATQSPRWVTPMRGAKLSGVVDEAVYSATATMGAAYRWDSVNGQYIYNWSTKGLTPGYWYTVYAQLDDGTLKKVKIGLK